MPEGEDSGTPCIWRFSIHLPFNLVQRVEETFRGDARSAGQHAEGIPAEQVPPGGMGPFDAHRHGSIPQLLGNAGKPDQGEQKGGGNAQQIDDPVAQGPSAEDIVQFILQTVLRHIIHEE